MGHETFQKDSYNIIFEMVGGRKNRYNSPGHGKPTKPGKRPKQEKPSPQGGSETNNDYNDNNNHHLGQIHPLQHGAIENINHSGQNQPQHQGFFVPTPPGPDAYAYAAPYPYQYPPPPYPNQLAVGGYNGDSHVQGYPYPGSFVPHLGGYIGRHKNDVGLVGAAIGVASFGIFKLMRERRR